ncbi:replicative DNA helicase [Cohnella cholangitidis]|uniref:Replicative DNA helicase n=1 Tax=Cohnella cholangitidis TaxID=2598458 RepID=A0A7G5C3D8_9BACL|nr:replicative DNA helicase [Cohnella cholangitidis]QMV43722.1 replicative DNA helicase [Cohnella cholangitidis]
MNDLDNWLDMQPQADIEAEHATLGAILLEPDTLDLVRERLQGGEFYEPAHRKIFRAMVKVTDNGNPLDLRSLTAELSDSKELESVGGIMYLTRLVNSTPTAANAAWYAERVADVFLRRETFDTLTELWRKAMKQTDTRAFLEVADQAISKISDRAAPKQEFRKIQDVIIEVIDQAEVKYNNREKFSGVTGTPSGYVDLDKMTSGFQSNDLIIVAARPSVGKTAFALNIAQNVAVRTEQTVAVFSLEMSAGQLVQRMVCAEGNIDASRMRSGFFEGEDWARMGEAAGLLGQANIFIDDTPGITVNEIRSKCRRLKKEQGIGLILIDYLQLIQSSGRGANRQEEVSHISRTLKQIARELEVPVIALSQLSRGVEQRQDKRPMMSDLRESGAIEQDADIVAFLYRDDYYDKESEKKNLIEIIIAKQRNGPVGTVELVFLKQFNKFVSLDRSHGSAFAPPLKQTGTDDNETD